MRYVYAAVPESVDPDSVSVTDEEAIVTVTDAAESHGDPEKFLVVR